MESVGNQIDKSIKSFLSNLSQNNITSQLQCTVEIKFYSVGVERSFLRSTEVHTDFERWIIALKLNFKRESTSNIDSRRRRLVDQVRQRIVDILRTSCESVENLPDLPECSVFHPFTITLPTIGAKPSTWVQFIQRSLDPNQETN